MLIACRGTFVDRNKESWVRLSGLVGPSAVAQRLDALNAEVLAPLPRAGAEGSLVDDVIEIVRAAAVESGFDIGDVVVPSGDVFGRSIGPLGTGPRHRAG